MHRGSCHSNPFGTMITERIKKYFREKSAFRITTDLVFYLLILAVLLPFSRRPLATGMNRILMHRPSVMNQYRQITLNEEDFNWMLLDLEGSPVPFSQFRGQVIFLNFWATWCPPCRAELPDIQRLYDQYGERMAIILASQEGAEALESFLNEKGYVLPVYRLVQNPPEKLMASTLPTTFLITGNDRITIRKTGAARWNGEYFKNYLESLLGDSGAGR